MDETSKKIITSVLGQPNFDKPIDLDGLLFPRETLLCDGKYDEVKKWIPELKKNFSSSFMTGLQKKADIVQKWPLLNLIRQILNIYHMKMIPIRKSDGYTLDKIKKYKRFFMIVKKEETSVS